MGTGETVLGSKFAYLLLRFQFLSKTTAFRKGHWGLRLCHERGGHEVLHKKCYGAFRRRFAAVWNAKGAGAAAGVGVRVFKIPW